MSHQPISWTLAFLAGLVSFVSPCVLPIVPSYVSYITGLSFEELTGRSQTLSRGVIVRESPPPFAGKGRPGKESPRDRGDTRSP